MYNQRTDVNCRLAEPLLNAYVDGELAASLEQNVVGHLADCAACDQQVYELQTLQSALASEAVYYHAPGTLRSRVEQTLSVAPSVSLLFQPVSTKSAISTIVVLALFTGFVALAWQWWPNQPVVTLAQLSLRTHVRAVSEKRQTEVTSADPYVVANWLQKNTGKNVTISDLSTQKYQLAGARVEHTGLGKVPVLVYATGDQTVNLYLWPHQCDFQKHDCCQLIDGYLLLNWSDAEATYWAVSTISSQRLDEFAGLVRSKSVPRK